MGSKSVKAKTTLVPPFPIDGIYPTWYERKIIKIKNIICNHLYPASPTIFAITNAVTFTLYSKYRLNDLFLWLPKPNLDLLSVMKTATVVVCISYMPVFVLRFLLSQFYFSYKRFIFESPESPSTATKIWAACRKLLSYTKPGLLSCNALLPKLPVPDLSQTVSRYLSSMEPLLSPEDFKLLVEKAKMFEKKEGWKLQWITKLYSLFTDNYVTGFWEKYAYHYSRECVLITSSVAHVDLFFDVPATQAVRAAHASHIETLSSLAMAKETLPPLGGGIMCTNHYRKLYSCTRVPGKTIDHLETYTFSRHIIVISNGCFYRVEMFDENNKILSINELVKVFTEISRRAKMPRESEARVAALTTAKRNEWHDYREKFFLRNETNRKTLMDIESAIFVMVLDDYDQYDYDPSHPELLDKFLCAMLTGDGTNRWSDKSLNYCITGNGRGGGTTEHSIADGIEFDHLFENYVFMDDNIIGYEELPGNQTMDVVPANLSCVKQLKFDINDEMAKEINRCYEKYQEKRNDVDMACLVFRIFGKGRIKTFSVSPDAFVQLAIQLANYKDKGKFVLTYESASTRFFQNARTETLRSVTNESCAFVKAMMDPNVSNDERIRLLRRASTVHTQKNRECMVGMGVDRHLFVLYIMSKITGLSSEFLDYYIKQPWLLSTSQCPNITNSLKEDECPEMSWIGAAFGATSPDGYGICYRFAGNHSICAHITSFKSSKDTDSHRFRQHLIDSFEEIAGIFE